MTNKLKTRYLNYIRDNKSFLVNRSFRFIGIPFLGIFVYLLIYIIHPGKEVGNIAPTWVHYLGDIVLSIMISVFIWEGSLIINKQIDRFFDWRKQPLKRLFSQITLNTIYSSIIILSFVIFYLEYIVRCSIDLVYDDLKLIVFISVVIFLLVDVVYIGAYFFRQWEQSTMEAEKLKQQNLISQYEALKNQVNPHFLFNSLNALTTLIAEDQELAIEFVQRIANVYRYVLQNKDKELVNLNEEVQFIKAFLFLQKIRFGENLIVNLEIPDCIDSYLIAPLSLQMLVENAIKHNIISHEKPLYINIIFDCGTQLIVKNNIQKKISPNGSTGIGLKNIIERYRLLMNKVVTISEINNEFVVCIPLIKENKKHESINN